MSIVGALPYPLTDGTTAFGSQVLADITKVKDDVNSNAAAAGANSNITSLTGLTTALDYTLGGSSTWIGTGGGTANAQTVATTYPITGWSLAFGKGVLFNASVTNTGAATLAVNGGTATALRKNTFSGRVALDGGEIISGGLYLAVHNGTNFTLMGSITNNWGAASASFSANRNGVDQSVSASGETQVLWTTEAYDTGSYFATNAWTPAAGKLSINLRVETLNVTGVGEIRLKRGGTIVAVSAIPNLSGDFYAGQINWQGTASGSQAFDAYVFTGTDAAYSVYGPVANTYFMGTMI